MNVHRDIICELKFYVYYLLFKYYILISSLEILRSRLIKTANVFFLFKRMLCCVSVQHAQNHLAGKCVHNRRLNHEIVYVHTLLSALMMNVAIDNREYFFWV